MNIKSIASIVPFCLILSACVTATPTTLPSGAQGQIIRCPGMARSIADCYQKAGDICPAGYSILAVNGEATSLLISSGQVSGSAAGFGGGYSTIGGSVVRRSLIVQCH